MDGSSNPYAAVGAPNYAAPLVDFTQWQNKQPQQQKPAGAPPVGPNAPPGAPMNLAPGAQPAPAAPPQGGGQQFAAMLQKLFGNIGQGGGGGPPNGGAPPMRNDINGRPIGGPQAMVGPNGPQGLY